MVKIFRFTTTTTPRRISYVGIRRISTGAQKILSQFSFNNGTERKALSLKVMITTTMPATTTTTTMAVMTATMTTTMMTMTTTMATTMAAMTAMTGDNHDGGNDYETTTRR